MRHGGHVLFPFSDQGRRQPATWRCPGQHESAGKTKGGKTRKGSKWLRLYLHDAARAAGRTKGTYLSAQYSRRKARRSPAKARVAVEHSILVALFHMLDRDESC
ncbi:transposase [Frankia nepalensis]|uniref:transposase n=1 Tax=Frankia nepalensis TaxID=1836974 RepID=UPI001EE3C171|nr:transposase [Frankia nepalensis]